MSRRGSKSVRHQDRDTDCTPDCACPRHASVILTSVALGNLRLLQHCASLCGNAWRIADSLGRTPLHVAASHGHLDIAKWLVAKKKVAVDTVDGESGWSALHRSVYFGELGMAACLMRHGASLSSRDNDELTPLSLLNKDRLQLRCKPDVNTTDVYTWGSNANTTLGHAHSRPHPERLELPPQFSITQVALEKFHSVLLTSCGVVLTCGHGRGGRLGHGSEASVVSPRVVEALRGERCVSVAAARNHTVFLTHSGVVYTCGLNDAHQLGLGSAPNSTPKQCLTPTPISSKVLKGRHVQGIGAGRYHTALCTGSEVYTFGQNLGQLGYEKNYHTQILPKAVAQINVDPDDGILSLSASHAATAVLTKKHRIFVCYDFTVKSLRCGFLEKLQCAVFQVCASLTDRAHLRSTSPEPTKILLLDTEHKLWYWEPGKKGTVPYILPGLAKHNVIHFTLGRNLTIVTEEGEVFSSVAMSGQPLSLARLASIQNARAVFTDFKAVNFAYIQNVYSVLDLPHVAPSTLTSDLSSLLKEGDLLESVSDINLQAGGQAFPAHRYILSLLSSHPLPSPLPPLSNTPPHMLDALLHYLYGSEVRLIPIANVSESLLAPPTSGPHAELTPDTSFTSIDENDLTEMYDQFSNQGPPRSSLEENGFEEVRVNLADEFNVLHIGQSTPKKRSKLPLSRDGGRGESEGVIGGGGGEVKEVVSASVRKDLQTLLKLATEFEVPSLKTRLESVLSNFSLKLASRPVVLTPPPLPLSPSLSPTLTDITIHTSDHQSLSCHKCVLVARSEYFKSMLLMGWRESADGATSLSLPFSHQLLHTVILYMYTDTAPSVINSDSLEWVVQVLVIADQLLLTRLRDICEQTLASKLTLRSVCDILEVSAACSAAQLKRACLQFIGANAAALLEGRFLESLNSSLLTELSTVYKEMIPLISKRVIKFPEPDPSELPESYFLESGRGGSQEEGEDDMERGESVRSPTQESPVHTPHSSNRRRRREARKRRSSQSEAKRSQLDRSSISPSPTPVSPPLTPSTVPPLSPVGQEDTPKGLAAPRTGNSGQEQTSLSGSKAGSEASLSTPKTPIESSLSVKTGSASSSSLRASGKRQKHSRKKLMDAYGENPDRREKEREKEGGVKGDREIVVKGDREIGVKGENEGGVKVEEEGPPSHKLINGIPHTSPGQLKGAWGGGGREQKASSASPPSPRPTQSGALRTAWSRNPPTEGASAGGGRGISLKEIMAEEERERKKAHTHPPLTSHPSHPPTLPPHKATAVPLNRCQSYPPQSHTHSLTSQPSSSKFIPSIHHHPQSGTQHSSQPSSHSSQPQPFTGRSSPQSLPASTRGSLDSRRGQSSVESCATGPLSSSLPHSPPSNPWHTSQLSTSPVVSLKDLMAEETQRAQQRKKTSGTGTTSSSSASGRHLPLSSSSPSSSASGLSAQRVEERKRPIVQPPRPASFADIILSQQREQENQQRSQVGKPLSCIQIEEQAILELEALYSCHDNPDEFITVRRLRPSGHAPSYHHSVSHTYSATNSPWNNR